MSFLYFKNLVHACQCRDTNCQSPSCPKMKRVVSHTQNCTRKSRFIGGCPICKQMIALCCYHAIVCQEDKCPVQFCQIIKQKLRMQQLQQQQTQIQVQQANEEIESATSTKFDSHQCGQCSQSFKYENNLKTHIEYVHRKNDIENCSNLQIHNDGGANEEIESTTPLSPFVCHMCWRPPTASYLLNCGHLQFCNDCSLLFINERKKCPICKTSVTSRHRAFVEVMKTIDTKKDDSNEVISLNDSQDVIDLV